MALKRRSATLAGLRDFDDGEILRLVSVTEVLGDEGLPNLGARVELEARGTTFSAQLVPDAATYGWDWDGVRANLERMQPEMAVDSSRLEQLERAVRDVTALDSVDPIVQATVV
jgi:hypothetical protein